MVRNGLKALVILLVGIGLVIPAAIAAPTGKDAQAVFKSYYSALHHTKSLDEYMAVEKRFAGREKRVKINESEADMKKFPPTLFHSLLKSDLHNPSQLVFRQTDVSGNKASVRYGLKGNPQFSGVSGLIYENNVWKVIETKHVTKKDGATFTTTF